METTFDKALKVAKEKYPYQINHYEEYRDYFVFEHDDGIERIGGPMSPIVIRKSDMHALNYASIFFDMDTDAEDVGDVLAEGEIVQVPAGAAVLMAEPLQGWSVDDMRRWLGDEPSDDRLAQALALTHGKAGWLMDLFDDDASFKADFDAWWEYEKELYSKVLAIQDAEGDEYDMGRGLVAAVDPFMSRNGYVNSCGWWVKRDC